MRPALLLAATLTVLTGCRGKADDRRAPPPPDPGGGVVPGFATPPPLPPLAWGNLADPSAFGVPAGCTLTRPVQRAALPKGAVRFVAPRGSDGELLLAVDTDGDGLVDRDAVLDTAGRPTRPLPWQKLAAPPLFARARDGYLALVVEDTGSGMRRASVWREPGRLEALAEGDRLEATDAACDAGGCALLLSVASASAGPGATTFFRPSTAGDGPWRRVDLSGEAEGFVPFSVVAIGERGAVFALEALPLFSVWEARDGAATPLGRLRSPFGVYDVLYDARGKSPIAVAPSESVDEPCTMDGFNVRLIDAAGKAEDVFGQVPPAEVVTRPLTSGSIVTWLAPVSCRKDGQSIVRAFLVDLAGHAASSTMAVTDGDGFALSTSGDTASLWVSRRGELQWATMRCQAAPKQGSGVPSP